MAFPFEEDEPQADETEEAPAEEGSNRTFLYAMIGLGGLFLVSLLCVAVWYFMGGSSNQQNTVATQQALTFAQNTQVAQAADETQQAMLFTPTVAITDTPTPTPVLAQPSETPIPPAATVDPITATVAAAYTQAALAQLTVIPTTTALSQVPNTGFADDVGIPFLVISALVLLVVMFFARQLRSRPARR